MAELRVLGEESGWVALAKPAGIPVFPPHADPGGDCVLARGVAAGVLNPDLPWPEGFAGGIAHRLDTPTSGQLLAARSLADLESLRAQFAAGSLRKTYRFLTRREVPWEKHTVETPIAHDPRRKDRMICARGAATPHRGRWYPAKTSFRRLVTVGEFTVWEAVIETGVTHQIRVHAASVGLALAGDRIYGGGPSPPGLPPGVPFLLHHLGLRGPDLHPQPCPLPDFWPAEGRKRG